MKWHNEKRKLSELIPYEMNPRQLTVEQHKHLTASLKKFDLAEVPAINTDNTIVAGHQRTRILAELHGLDYEIDVRVPDKKLTKADFEEYLIRSNLNTGEFDMDVLSGFDEMKLLEWGFSEDELQFFTADEFIDGVTDEDDVPEVEESITKPGDLWLLGEHRVLCGDATISTDVEKLMDGEKADMVFTDPPYDIGTDGGWDVANRPELEFIANFNPDDFLNVLPLYFEGKKLNSYIFCNKQLLPDYLTWARDSGYSFNVLVWKKPNAIPIGDSHRPDIEYLLLFRKNAIWNNGLSATVNYSRLIENQRETGLHPTMKPVAIITNQLLISSNKGSIVADPFLGSGSTLIACEKTNRKCYGMELDPHYTGVIVKRWEDFTGNKATLSK